MPLRRRRPVFRLGLLLALSAAGTSAQTITGITVHQPFLLNNTVGGSGSISNVYVTAGTAPQTDAFLYNGNDSGFFDIPTLSPGLNTFYLWTCCTTLFPSAAVQVNLFAGGNNTNPALSASFNGGLVDAFQNVEGFSTSPAAGSTAVIDNYFVTITNWSSVVVNRAVNVGPTGWLSSVPAGDNFTGKLELQVTPVPEPATVALFSLGLAGVAVAARRRRAADEGPDAPSGLLLPPGPAAS